MNFWKRTSLLHAFEATCFQTRNMFVQGEDTGSDGGEEREDGEANEAAEEEERERQRRIEESLRKREEEVQRALAGHLRDRDKERMQHKHDEAVHNFNALLADLVGDFFYLLICH